MSGTEMNVSTTPSLSVVLCSFKTVSEPLLIEYIKYIKYSMRLTWELNLASQLLERWHLPPRVLITCDMTQ